MELYGGEKNMNFLKKDHFHIKKCNTFNSLWGLSLQIINIVNAEHTKLTNKKHRDKVWLNFRSPVKKDFLVHLREKSN